MNMKFFKHVLLLFIAIGMFISCSDDDNGEDPIELAAPLNVDAVITISQDDSGTVTVIPSADGASSFEIFFGDEDNETATTLSPGQTAMNTYPEGDFVLRVVAIGLTGLTSEFEQGITISFNAPENLEIIIGEVQGQPTQRTVSATADFATMFNVFFGDVENEEPTQIMLGETITHTFAATGEFTIRVVAISGSSTTIEGTETVIISSPIPLPVDFESDTLIFPISGFEGADSALEVNPDPSGINTSETVLRSTKTEGAQFFAGTILELGLAIDFSSTQILQIDTYSPKADIPVRLRIENADNSVGLELDVNTTTINTWETLNYDFSGMDTSADFVRVVVFFEFIPDLLGDGSTYFYDNLMLASTAAPEVIELPVDFESTTIDFNLLGFEGADSAVESNPDASGINTSSTVLRSIKTVGAQFFAGTILDLDVPIDFSSTQVLQIDTYSPKADIPIRIALENQAIGGGSQVFIDVNTTTINTWETLMADFSSVIDPSVQYDRVVVFFEFIPDLPGDGSTYFYDNLRLTN